MQFSINDDSSPTGVIGHDKNKSTQMSTTEIMKKMNMKLHEQQMSQMSQFSQFSAISGISSHISQDSTPGMNLNMQMPAMSNFMHQTMNQPSHAQIPRPHIPFHMQQSTGLDKYVSQLRNIKNQKNVPPSNQPILQPNYANSSNKQNKNDNKDEPIKPPLLQNYSEDDSYFIMQLENEEMIDYHESQDFDQNDKFNIVE